MAQDLIYYYDKTSPYQRHIFGEIQTEFNMSLVIDGTKDSMQIEVHNFSADVLLPNTIIKHSATNLYWLVKKDKVKRSYNENGFYYVHTLSILGCIDLLNSRDLTDCGFNDKTYTIDQFIKRLFKLSTYEFPITISYGNNVDENKIIDYIKTYENYTTLSALRDFLNGYNCDSKLSFNETSSDDDYYLSGATLTIIPKTGNIDLPIVDIDEFDDVREIRDIDSNNYGTTVISNAQNVVSTLAKTYPQVGAIRCSADDRTTTLSNAIIRLPTPIYKVNWLKAISTIYLYVEIYTTSTRTIDFQFDIDVNASLEQQYDLIAKEVKTIYSSPYLEPILTMLERNKKKVLDVVRLAGSFTLYTGWKWNPINATFIAPTDNPNFYFPKVTQFNNNQIQLSNANVLLGVKEDYDVITYQRRCLYYERGGQEIKNLAFLGEPTSEYGVQGWGTRITTYASTDLRSSAYDNSAVFLSDSYEVDPNTIPEIRFYLEPLPNSEANARRYDTFRTRFVVNYIPMSDIKAKTDNANNTKDIKIYNQNGKLNDSVALSKLLDSYSKEIQNETITRYMHYTNFADIPQVGSLVDNNGETFVINNISYDFYPNESTNDNTNVGYYIECEFTMSKYISTKSIMTSPNSNIRDYGIPQKYNIKRRQVYRDYFEFDFVQDTQANQETPYVSLDKYLQMGYASEKIDYDHTAFIKVVYEEPVSGSDTWYYQLNTTAYVLNKSVYEIVDFNDNNIIGYDMQNRQSGFDMGRIGRSNYESINTPISYVDESGKVKSIYLAMVNAENTGDLYLRISNTYSILSTFLSTHCFIDGVFYNGQSTIVSSQATTYTGNESGYENNHSYVDIELDTIQEDIDLDTFVVDSVSGTWTSPDEANWAFINPTTEIVEINGIKYLRIWDYDPDNYNYGENNYTWSITLTLSYTYLNWYGAKDIADYVLEEVNYDKDAIEVPVFEYSMQLGDTHNVEVGDEILSDNNGYVTLYYAVVRNKNTTSKLNANKFTQEPTINVSEIVGSLYYSYQYRVYQNYGVNLQLENNNTQLRISILDKNNAVLFGNANQSNIWLNGTGSGIPIAKENFVDKDILIFKDIIKNLNYDSVSQETEVEHEQQLMFIIHAPQNDNFDGNDIILNANYYKLN